MDCTTQESTMRRVTEMTNIYNPHQYTNPRNNLQRKGKVREDWKKKKESSIAVALDHFLSPALKFPRVSNAEDPSRWILLTQG